MSAVVATQPATTCAQGHVALPVATAPSTSPVADTAQAAAEAYKAAMARARKAGGRIKRTSDTTWVAESTSCPGQFHEIVKFGPCWHNFRCSCIGASRANAVCLHMALAAASHHYNLPGIRFKTPAPAPTSVVEQAAAVATPVLCDTCQSPSPDAERCAECVALYGAVGTPVELTPMYLDTLHAMERFAPAIQPTPISPALIQASLAADRARNEAAHAERHAADRVYVAAQRKAGIDPLAACFG